MPRAVRLPLALCFMLLGAVPGMAAARNMLYNPGFEPPAQDGMAAGWLNNTWGDCKTVFSLDRDRPHSGQTSQKVQCLQRTGGASQFLQPMRLEKGKLYQVRMWVRAEGNVPSVGACLRQSPEPYAHHVESTFEPGRDWEIFEFEGVNAEPEDQAGLYIWFEAEGSGTIWVDDASVEVLEPRAPTGPPPEGNVVPNGSFEVDPARTWAATPEVAEWPPAGPVAHGRRSLLLRLGAGRSGALTTPCIAFNGGGLPFTLALAARARGWPVTLQADVLSAMQVAQGGSLLHLDAKPDGQMRRFSAAGLLQASLNGAYYLQIHASADKPADLWLDAVSLSREGEAFRSAAPLEAALSTKAFAGIYAPDEPVTVKLEAFTAGRPFTGQLCVEVRDHRERLVCARPVLLTASADRLASANLTLPVPNPGAFRADVLAPGQPKPLASMVFSVVPRPRAIRAADSCVGGHFSTASDWQMAIARRLGYHWTRIHDCSTITHWASVEPEKGRWRFFDDEVARVRRAGLEILGEFLRVPAWATTAQKGTQAYAWGVGPFRDTGELSDYVRAVVEHYKPAIHYWEIWNEPYGDGFWGGTPEQHAALAQAAGSAAKAADPSCTLLAPCTTPYAPEWTEKTLAAGALARADLFSFHGYGCFAKGQYDKVEAWARRDGVPMRRWNTETGVTARTFYRHITDRLDNSYTRWIGGVAEEEAAAQVAKLFCLTMASGADRFFYYWTNVEDDMCPRMTSMSIYEYDRTIRPHGVAFAIAASLLDPCKGLGVGEEGGITWCLLRHDRSAIAVLWAASKLSCRRLRLAGLPGDVKALDLMGNLLSHAAGTLSLDVTREPMYLVTLAASAGALARSVAAAAKASAPR